MTATLVRDDIEAIGRAALRRQAQERLARIEERRDAARLDAAGMSQRDIAEALHTTQPRVHRMLKVMALPGMTEPSPEEVILRATVNGTDRDELVATLQGMDYTFTVFAPEPHEGSVPGTWNQVRLARRNGLLTEEEFERVKAVVNPSA